MFSAQSPQQAQVQVQVGAELPTVDTQNIGFLSVSGESKIRLLPEPWPADSLPKPTSSLLSIASRNELVAAAGPKTLVIGSTSAVRNAFSSGTAGKGPGGLDVKTFNPELTLNTPRISQVVFSSDENFLVISAEEGGGIAAYNVQALKQGTTNPAFEIGTNGTAVRALVPNPEPEHAHRFAIVLSSGQLLMADLKERNLSQGQNGVVLQEGVSCVSWSARGKQLVAGLGDGTALQMDVGGNIKAQIPRYPSLANDQHVSDISWLDNDHFLIIYSPSNEDMNADASSTYHYVSREPKTTNFMFQLIPEPVLAVGLNRSPAHHFICRLRNFKPNLSDALVLASTESCDIGLIACSASPLSPASPESATKYVNTTVDDARKAQLPVYTDESNGQLVETSPIGLALDLSSRDTVKKPIPSDEMDASATPLPNIMALNPEGILSSWWFVYSDSVKAGEPFSGLVVAGDQQSQTQIQSASQPSTAFGTPSQHQQSFASSAFGSNTFGSSPFGQVSSAQPAFGTPTAPITSMGGSGFGSTTFPGAGKSPWGSAGTLSSTQQPEASSFGQPAFGSATQMGNAGGFGSAGGLGAQPSPWGQSSQAPQTSDSNSKPANPFSSTSATSPFASVGQQSSDNAKGNTPFSPFSSFAGSSGFANLRESSSKSVFTSQTTTTAPPPPLSGQPSFGSTITIGSNPSSGPSMLGEPKSSWGTPSLSNNTSGNNDNKGLFGLTSSQEPEMTSGDMDNDMETEDQAGTDDKTATGPADGLFGIHNDGPKKPFQANSSFKPGPKASNTNDKEQPKASSASLFGADFEKSLPDTQKPKEKSNAVPPITTDSTQSTKEYEKKETKEKTSIFELSASSWPSEQQAKSSLLDTAGSTTAANKLAQDTEPKTLPAASLQGDSKEPASPAKADSELSWESVDSNASEEGVEPAPLPLSHSLNKSQQVEEPPLPPSQSSAPTIQQEPSDPPLPPSPPHGLAQEQTADPPLPPSPPRQPIKQEVEPPFLPTPPDQSIRQNVAEPPLPPTSSATEELNQPRAEPPASPPGLSDTPVKGETTSVFQTPVTFGTSSRLQDTSNIFSGKQAATFPRSPSPRKPQPLQDTFSVTPAASPLAKTSGATRAAPIPTQQSALHPKVVEQRRNASQRRTDIPPEIVNEYQDDSDFRIQEELASSIEPTRRLAPFIAYQDYARRVSGDSIAGQIEKVFRDVQSMIDTLGLNARTLKAFIAGNEQFKDSVRDSADLDAGQESGWSLVEVEDLRVVERGLEKELDLNRLSAADDRVAKLPELQKDVSKLRTQLHGLQQLTRSSEKEGETGETRTLLTIEQSEGLAQLRKSFTEFQTHLAQAEDSLTVLRARVASAQAASQTSGSPKKTPTFEAVSNTISKMTRMLEQKSGDVDVLEAQIRKMKLKTAKTPLDLSASLGENFGRLSLGSSASPGQNRYRTPPNSRGRMSAQDQSPLAMSKAGTYQLTYESESDDENYELADDGSPGQRKAQKLGLKVSREQVTKYSILSEHRKMILGMFKKKVCERGTYVQTAKSGPGNA